MKKCIVVSIFAAVALNGAAERVLMATPGPTRVDQYIVENGTWTLEKDFCNATNNYGGAKSGMTSLATDGDHIFVGENGIPFRILEFDRQGNYIRTLAKPGQSVQSLLHPEGSPYLYATIGPWTDGFKCVYRYNLYSGEGGSFINQAVTNNGELVYTFLCPSGIVSPTNSGVLWVADRNNGRMVKFNIDNGTYLGVSPTLSYPNGLYYSPEENVIYGACGGTGNPICSINPDTGGVIASWPGLAQNLHYGFVRIQNTMYVNEYATTSIYKLNDNHTVSVVGQASASMSPYQMDVLPETTNAWRLLVSDTGNNRVLSMKCTGSSDHYEIDSVFAGGSQTYGGIALRSPRGIASFSNHVYIAEGVPNGRILDFSKRGGFRRVLTTINTESKPCALACSPNGQTLYVTECWSLTEPFTNNIEGQVHGTNVWAVNTRSGGVSLFANQYGGSKMYEMRGVAVNPSTSDVYISGRYQRVNINAPVGFWAAFKADGTRITYQSADAASLLYWDKSGNYLTPLCPTNTISGAGLLAGINGMQDIWWLDVSQTNPQNWTQTKNKVLDLGIWVNYLDAEVIHGRILYTRTADNQIGYVTGLSQWHAILTDATFNAPSYMEALYDFPSDPGTVVMLK